MNIKKVLTSLLIVALPFSLIGCGNKAQSSTTSTSNDKKTLTVGTSPTFKDEINVVKAEFEKDGYKLNVKVFDDYVTPDVALNEGSIDFNFYQHEPYLNQFNKSKNTKLVKVGTGVLKYYMGIYSKKIKNISDIKDGATVSIPNDASNRARALKVLQTNGIIKLKDDVVSPTKLDIVENKKNLNIVEMDVMKLVPSLGDVDFSVINSIIAVQGGIDPKSAIAYEDNKESDKYAIIVAAKSDSNKEMEQRFEKAIKSEKVKKFLEEKYKGAVIPLF